ncbi:hypothetical protein F511_02250 [Dorcoceras hygrometricum]|uniref:Protein NRT1/ PTR FAMILY 2.8-like n=1 Tax=Dorcoceras hygrometricum TaxID=472368 RepID=A0A2Z7AV85_9LAMI|nr:hypothetical protein F511_02250 [Dorcoceras hygrometricum]
MEIGSHSHPSPRTLSQSKKPGGWRAIKYILGNESFEKLASISLVSNITVYLRTKYNLSGIFLVNTVMIWSGSTNLSSIAGAIVSDVYWDVPHSSVRTIFTLLGMGVVTLTAGIPDLRPPACIEGDYSACVEPEKWQLGFLFTGLGLVALGAGGIRPCNIAFGADQFDTKTEKGRAQLESFFNWWYFSFTIALIIALTGVIYVQTNVSWTIGYAIPTACLAVSITIFLIGMSTYIYKRPQGTVFADMAKVMVAAYRKRKIDLTSGDGVVFYDGGESESESKSSKTIKADRFKCLDKAAVISDPSEVDTQSMPKDGWKLCSVQQVENLKCLFGIGPVWVSGVGCFVVMDQQSTFGILQSFQMNRMLGKSFTIPPAWMGISSMVALSIWIFIYEQIYVKKFKKILKKTDLRMTMQQRITTGIIMSILCMVVAGVVEKKRKELALRDNTLVSSLHVTALLPQFILSGLTEAFAAVAIMEFFTIQMPESMRSVAGSIFFLSLSIASYLSSFLVNVIHSVTDDGGDMPWLGGNDLNKNKLEYYYYFIACLGVLNLFYFTFFARSMCFAAKVKKAPAVKGHRRIPGFTGPAFF